MLIALATQGVGVTMLPDFQARAEIEVGALTALGTPETGVEVQVFALTESAPPEVDALVHHLRDALSPSTQENP